MSARWVTWVDEEPATVELVERSAGHVVARLETKSGVREVRFEIPVRSDNGERVLRHLDGRPTAAWVGAEQRGERTIAIAGRDIVVRARRELDAWLSAGDDAGGSGAVTVAMPGRVVKILAQIGEHVDKGQPVLIIEAMKMENEVKARRSGVVQAVNVVEGGSVEGGRVLMEIA